jgi:hypothetical protein
MAREFIDMPGDRFISFVTAIGVGVERSAIGDKDNPLSDIVRTIGETFGPGAKEVVDGALDALITSLGPDLLADVDLIVLPSEFDVSNGRADVASVPLPEGPYILDIGEAQNVGNGEFARIILGAIDSDGDDNDAEQLLSEILTGASGAKLDYERVPGIDGVRLADISRSGYTLEIEDGSAVDTLTFMGDGAEAVIARLDAPANLADFRNDLSLVEVGAEDVDLGIRWFNPIFDFVGNELDSAMDVTALVEAAVSGDDRLELIGLDDSRVSLVVHNHRIGSADTLVLYGDVVEQALEPEVPPLAVEVEYLV